MEPVKIKANHGYWRTNAYPIGGDFRRASCCGEIIIRVIRTIEPPVRGCDIEVELSNNITAAVNSANTIASCDNCLNNLRQEQHSCKQ